MKLELGSLIVWAVISIFDLQYVTLIVNTTLFYHNIALKDILKLQCVQNCLARVITRSPRFSHSVPLGKSLHWLPVIGSLSLAPCHWLPVRNRIIFKICIINFQALSSKEPAYLHLLLTLPRQPRQLRSSNSYLLFIASVKTNVGTRAFSVAAPTLWNSVPVSVKSVGNITTFRRKLKTDLFKLTYPPQILSVPFCFGALPSLGFPRSLAQYMYFISLLC